MNPYQQHNIENGKCANGCGRALATKLYCRQCVDKAKRSSEARRKFLIQSGQCRTGCGRPLSTQSYCRECADRKLTKTKELVTSGKCQQGCGRDRVTKTLCRECADKYTSRQRGISVDELRQKRLKQNGVCVICETSPMGSLNVDHHHAEGYIRDLLCSDCNRGIGVFKEDVVRLKRAASYISHHNRYKGKRPFKSRLKQCNT